MSIPVALTLAGCLTAAFFDVRARRIPNALTGSLVLAALIVHGLEGLRPLGISFAVMAVLTIAGALVYARGGIGGGDVKLAIAGSGMLSYPLCVPYLFYTAIGGGILAMGYIALRIRARASAVDGAAAGAISAPGPKPAKGERMPYAVAFAFGAILVALSQHIAPFLMIRL